jgi:hypothetical protein
MAKLSLNEIKKTLEGTEIWSIEFEALVTINNGKIEYILNDTKHSINGTSEQWHTLLNEAFESEFSSDWEHELIKEFESYK